AKGEDRCGNHQAAEAEIGDEVARGHQQDHADAEVVAGKVAGYEAGENAERRSAFFRGSDDFLDMTRLDGSKNFHQFRNDGSGKKTLRYLYFEEDEHPIAAQLFGANPKVMAEAARIAEDLGYDAVDINLGCPAKKVVKCGGSGLLRELP